MSIVLNVLESIFPVFAIILTGYLMQHAHWFSERFASDISDLIMKVALPASIFTSVTSNLTASQLSAFADGVLIGGSAVAISYAVAFLLCKVLHIRRGRRGTFINTFANANTVFIGMPMNIALFGEEADKYYLVYYVINTVSTWAVGSVLIAGDPSEDVSADNDDKKDHKMSWKQIFSPPMTAFLVSMVLVIFSVKIPSPITTAAEYVGDLVTPLALIYIGIVLSNIGLRSLRIDRDTAVALAGKFVVAPSAMILMLHIVTQAGYFMPVLEQSTLIMQSAMPALSIQAVLVNEGKGDVKYATGLVAISTILFVAAAPVMMLIIDAVV